MTRPSKGDKLAEVLDDLAVDVALVAEGTDADHWLDVAQAFAGPSRSGRAPAGASR